MSRGPFRSSRAADSRESGRLDLGSSQQSESRTPQADSRQKSKVSGSSERPAKKQTRGSSGRRWRVSAITTLIVIAVSVAGWFLYPTVRSLAIGIDSSRYQAVFFANGNVYFGKLEVTGGGYYKMSGVYYPQTQTDTAVEAEDQPQSSSNQDSITLLRLSDAIHSPEDEMMISKDQILFFQNIEADSQVAQLIEAQSN